MYCSPSQDFLGNSYYRNISWLECPHINLFLLRFILPPKFNLRNLVAFLMSGAILITIVVYYIFMFVSTHDFVSNHILHRY